MANKYEQPYQVFETEYFPAMFKVGRFEEDDNATCNYFRERSDALTEAKRRNKAERPKYRIYGRRQTEVNTDPQRRCYNGCHFSSEWVWGSWYNLGCVFTEAEAIQSVADWKQINPKRHNYKYNLETSKWPELDPYYKSAEFVKLGEVK